MASKDWKLPDAQHKITEEKGLDIENESIQRQWEKTIVSLIRLEDAFSDIDVYDDTEEGEIPYRQYLMRRWLFIHQDKYKNETLKDEDKKKVNELLKTKHIKEDKFMDVIGALITLDTEKQMDERFWNHLRVQRNILDFLYALWLDDDRTLVDEFSTIIKDLVEYDFSIAEEQMKERLNIA